MIPALSGLSVNVGPDRRLRHRCSSRYLRISPLHLEFHDPLPYSSSAVLNALLGLSPRLSHLTYKTTCTRFTPNDSEQRLDPPSYRGCWHEVSRSFLIRYCHSPWILAMTAFAPYNRALRPEGLHHSRGVAASGFPPLSNIPYCCLP